MLQWIINKDIQTGFGCEIKSGPGWPRNIITIYILILTISLANKKTSKRIWTKKDTQPQDGFSIELHINKLEISFTFQTRTSEWSNAVFASLFLFRVYYHVRWWSRGDLCQFELKNKARQPVCKCMIQFVYITRSPRRNQGADPENDFLHLDLHVTYADVIIVCFHDKLYQLKYLELECTLKGNFACSSHNDSDKWNKRVYHFVWRRWSTTCWLIESLIYWYRLREKIRLFSDVYESFFYLYKTQKEAR